VEQVKVASREATMAPRVAIVHSFYSSAQPSGENAVVDAELDLLEDAGVETRLFAARTNALEGDRLYRLRSAARVATGRGRSPLAVVADFDPDVVHVHNLFPNFGRSWVSRLDAPVVVTLHNFRFVCAAATLFRDGHLCTDCPDGRPWSAVRHRCYRNSVAATLPLAIAQSRGPASDPVLVHAARILCLSPRQRRLLSSAGISDDRLIDWSNFLPDALDPVRTGALPSATARRGCLCVSRLTADKGVLDLVEAWTGPTPLTVAGDGPQAAEVGRAAVGRCVDVRGRLPRAEVVDLMTRSAALVMPGGWPEVAPLTYVESLASGLPVIAHRETDLGERIVAQGTGAVIADLADAGAAVSRLEDDSELSAHCRRIFEGEYAASRYRARVLRLYEDVAALGRR
jgi:glycosyltransferase involved in cell wall biosynthesis